MVVTDYYYRMESSEVCHFGGLLTRVECRNLTGEISGSMGGCVEVSGQGGCDGGTPGITTESCGDGPDEPGGVVVVIG